MEESTRTVRKRKPFTQLTIPERETNNVQPQSKKLRTELPECEDKIRAGTLVYVTLKNFMCHQHFHMEYQDSRMIVVGKNGSGKSAIITALIVGLGGKANLTNRGTSIKGFIKAGQTSSTVEIQLRNGGTMAYRPNVYGRTITVIRHFNSSGTSNYRIKAESGDVVSTKASELKLIVSALNIQVDNPICLLTQDTSRNFLNSNNPKHKFTLFEKANRLDSLMLEFTKLKENSRTSSSLLTVHKQNRNRTEAEMEELSGKIKSFDEIESLKVELLDLKKELEWGRVKEAEDQMGALEAVIEKLQRKLQDVLSSRENRTARLEQLKEEKESLEKQISEIRAAQEVQSRPLRDIEGAVVELEEKYTEKRRKQSSIIQTIKSKTEDITVLSKEIAKVSQNMSKIEKEKIERLRNLTKLEEKIKGTDDHLQTSKNDLFQLKSDLDRREEEDNNLRTEIANIDNKIAAKKSDLNALQRDTSNTLLMYGKNIPEILKLIQQNKSKFRHPPKGPIGNYIKLKDKKWAVAIEGYISPGTLRAFIVDNKHDNALLLQIFNQFPGPKPAIITSKFIFRKHNIRNNLVRGPPDCVSFYEALDIEDPDISNCIVDQLSVEGVLLIPSNRRAIELMSNRANVPRNCHQGILPNGDRFYPDPNYKTYSSSYSRAQYLQVDMSELIQQLKEKIEEHSVEKRRIEAQRHAFRVDMDDKLRRRNQLEEQVRKLVNARTQIRRQLEELKSSSEPEVANVQVLETELVEIRNSLQEKTAELGVVEEDMKQVKGQIQEHLLKLKKLKAAVIALEERVQPLKEDIQRNTTRRKELMTSDEYERRKVSELEGQLRTERSEKAVLQTDLNNFVVTARLTGERPEEIRDVTTVDSKIRDVESSIRKKESNTENITMLKEQLSILNKQMEKNSVVIEDLKISVNELRNAYELRTGHFNLTKDYSIVFIKHAFKKVLEMRQFKGSLVVNYEEKKLELIVIPQQGSQGLTTTANLSGGERSFSTVAFLYSLWQCLEFPFYFLDEFDVYMDKMNRTKVMDILLQHATSKPHLQFVFLTPQDVSFIDKDVSVVRLEDPVRFNVQQQQ